jgi:hypothetical protein
MSDTPASVHPAGPWVLIVLVTAVTATAVILGGPTVEKLREDAARPKRRNVLSKLALVAAPGQAAHWKPVWDRPGRTAPDYQADLSTCLAGRTSQDGQADSSAARPCGLPDRAPELAAVQRAPVAWWTQPGPSPQLAWRLRSASQADRAMLMFSSSSSG